MDGGSAGRHEGVRTPAWLRVDRVEVGGLQWAAPVGRGEVRSIWCVEMGARPMGTGLVPVWWAEGGWPQTQRDQRRLLRGGTGLRLFRLQVRLHRQWPGNGSGPRPLRAWEHEGPRRRAASTIGGRVPGEKLRLRVLRGVLLVPPSLGVATGANGLSPAGVGGRGHPGPSSQALGGPGRGEVPRPPVRRDALLGPPG